MVKKDDGAKSRAHPETEVVHLGRAPFDHHGFVNPPVYRGSTVLFPTLERIRSRAQPYTYGRRATPTTEALEKAISELEGGDATILTSSGLAAVTTAFLAFVEAGDHVLITDSVYQPTRAFADRLLKRIGVEAQYYDPTIDAGIAQFVRPNTRLIFVESPGSQTFEMQDIPAIAEVAHARDIWLIADNTWASPLFCRPLALGADISIQAATKYIVGHADAMLGTVTATAEAARHLDRAKEALGTCPGTEETFLGLRGLRTLDVRLARHQTSAIDVARWLEARPEVARVIHPALESHPGHAIWKRDFSGSSGLFTVILKAVDDEKLAAFLDGLKYFGMGYSWGGYESLVIPFDPTSYRTATRWQAEGPALRFHIGLENVEDLKADIADGFARMKCA